MPCLEANRGNTLQTREITLEASVWTHSEQKLITGLPVSVRYEPSEYGLDYAIYDDEDLLGYIDDYRWYTIEFFIKLNTLREVTISQVNRSKFQVTIRLESDFTITNHPALRLSNRTGIYAIEVSARNSIYVGQARNINRRLAQHFSDLAMGLHHNFGLQKLWCECQPTDFTVRLIEDLSSFKSGTIKDQKELEVRERYWIARERDSDRITCLNETDGEFVETKTSINQKAAIAEENLRLKMAREAEELVRENLQDLEHYKRRKELRNQLKKLSSLIDEEDLRLAPMSVRLKELEDELDKECSIFFRLGFSTFKKRQKVRFLKEQIALAKERFVNEGKLQESYSREFSGIERELKSIVTNRQLRARANQRRFRLF